MRAGQNVRVTTGNWKDALGVIVRSEAPSKLVTYRAGEPRYRVWFPESDTTQTFLMMELEVLL